MTEFTLLIRVAWLALGLATLTHAQEGGGGPGGEGGGGGGGQGFGNEAKQQRIVMAHGICMGLAFAVLFPFGSIILRAFSFRNLVWVHGGWQTFVYCIALAGFGLGVWLAVLEDQLLASNGHSIIGIIVIGVLLFQPLGGFIHHQIWKRKQSGTVWGVGHRWIGRIALILGAINGGLGLQLSENSRAGEIAYSVLAAFFFSLWLAVAVWKNTQGRRDEKADLRGEEKYSTDSDFSTAHKDGRV
ncbi:hypothetical protein LTR66_004237 [Elasticomyces elasticus]|nr:hypothetical protein LTR66_004237 [Elasticomyces elasticus]